MVIRKKTLPSPSEKRTAAQAEAARSPAVTKVRIRTRDRIRIITAVPMTIPETISVSQTARKAFEQKKYLKISYSQTTDTKFAPDIL